MYISNVTLTGFFYIYAYVRMIVSVEESTSLSVNIFEDLDTIVTKKTSCNTDTPDNFTTDTEQKGSNKNSALVTALKKHI